MLTISEELFNYCTYVIAACGPIYVYGGVGDLWMLMSLPFNISPSLSPSFNLLLPFFPPFLPSLSPSGERKQSFQFTVHTESSWNKRKDYVIAAQSDAEMKQWVAAFKV